MTRPGLSAVLLAAAASLAAFGTARGERNPNAGIRIDVEIGRVLDEIESEHAEQTRLQSELHALEGRRAQLQAALKRRVRTLYRVTRSGMAPIGGGFEAIQRHVARLRRLRALVLNDQKACSAAAAQVRAAREQSALAQSSLARSREHLRALQGEQSRATALRIAPESSDRETSVSSIRSGKPFYGLRFSDAPAVRVRSNFEVQRGRLAAPVTGEVRVQDARRPESDGPALEFQAPAGTPVRAAAAGRVAFSDRYGSYGRLVVLDHGSNYFTAYGGLGQLDVQVGDDVSPYARLGTISGESGDPALLFEVRKGTRAVAPRPWLGL